MDGTNKNPKILTTLKKSNPIRTNREKNFQTPDPLDETEIFDIIRNLPDPEHPRTLEELGVVNIEDIKIINLSKNTKNSENSENKENSENTEITKKTENTENREITENSKNSENKKMINSEKSKNKVNSNSRKTVQVFFTPTVPNCSSASLIGLCIKMKLLRNVSREYFCDVFVKEGMHMSEKSINKQLNDKERVAAACENGQIFRSINESLSKADEDFDFEYFNHF